MGEKDYCFEGEPTGLPGFSTYALLRVLFAKIELCCQMDHALGFAGPTAFLLNWDDRRNIAYLKAPYETAGCFEWAKICSIRGLRRHHPFPVSKTVAPVVLRAIKASNARGTSFKA